MLLSPEFYKAIKNLQRLNGYLTTFPLQWDTDSQRFYCLTQKRKLIWWYAQNIIGCFGQCLLGCVFVMLYLLSHPSEGALFRFMGMFSLFLGTLLVLLIAAVLAVNGEQYANWLNLMLDFEHFMNHKFLAAAYRQRRGDTLGRILNYIIIGSVVVSPIFSLSAILTEFSPVTFLLKYVILKDSYHPFIYTASSFVCYLLITILVAESFRVLGVLFIIYVLSAQIFLSGFEILRRYLKFSDYKDLYVRHRICHVYSQLVVLQSIRWEVAGFHDFIIYYVGIIAEVLCNYISIVAYPIMPTSVYLCFPIISGIVFIIIKIILPAVASMNVLANELMMKMKVLRPLDNKYFGRKLKSMYPIQVRTGIGNYVLIKIDNRTKVHYIQSILDYTINAILMLPIAWLTRIFDRLIVNKV